jgi:hypothetical protein
VIAGAVFAALAVWTQAPGPHEVDGLGRLTAEALQQIRPILAADPPAVTRGYRGRNRDR